MAAVEELAAELRPPLSPEQALVEADRCLECGGPFAPAPCAVACPAGVDVPAFVGALADADPDEAARTILAENLLGGTCARVCPVEVLCQGACVLAHVGQPPIAIGLLQRFALDEGEHVLREQAPPTGKRVVVIGAGPAGLACAGELALRGHDVDVYDERGETGGLARYAIAPFRLHRDPLPAETELVERLGVAFHLGERIDSRAAFDRVAGGGDAIVLATGMGADSESGCPGQDLDGVWDSLPFIETLKVGEPPEVGERVVVIGGGNTAMDVAREALRLGARDVTVLYRRTRAELPAYDFEYEDAVREGVRFRWLTAPVRFLGNGRVAAVECRLMRLGPADESGRRRPEPVEGSEFLVAADTVIEAIGQRGRPELAQWVADLELRRGDTVVVDEATGRTSSPRVFAGGDVVSGGGSVVEAVRDGKRAAKAIDEALR